MLETLNTTLPPMSLSDSLRAATQTTHERLDHAIMDAKPFESVENYGRFLRVQYGILHDVEPLYHIAALADIFDNLSERSRFEAVKQDLADLGLDVAGKTEPPATTAQLGIPEALGWLYVVEGSNLGAAFLLKFAKKMSLSETHGARHLAEPAGGRARSWKAFREVLNAVPLSEEERHRSIAAAETAFARVRILVRRYLD